MSAEETVRLIVDMGPSAKNVNEVSTSLVVLDKNVDEVAKSTEKLKTGMAGTGQSLLQTGRVVQDFAQGGLGGILNNIEGLSLALGGGAGLAGVMTVLGVAALVAGPAIKEWAKSLGTAGEKIPESTDAVEKYTTAIDKNKEAMKALKEQESLNYADLEKYKKLVDETAQLEEERANAREARAVKDGSSKADRARAAAVRETISERYGSGQELIDAIMATEHGQQIGLKRVEEVIAGAQRGSGVDLFSLQNISPQFKERYTPFSPEAKASFEKAQADFKKEQAFQAEREKSIKEKEKADGDARKEVARANEEFAKAQAQAPKEQFRAFLRQGRSDRALRGDISAEQKATARRAAAQQEQMQVRGIQQEAAGQGLQITPAQANELLRQRKAMEAELTRLTAQGLGANLESNAQMMEQIRLWRQYGQQQQMQRSGASNGFAQ